MAPVAKKGRPAGSAGVPKILRQYIALQKAGYSLDDAEKILAVIASVK